MRVSPNRRHLATSVLAHHFHPGEKLDLATFIPELREGGALASGDLTPLASNPLNILEEIHYSWLIPILQNEKSSMQTLFLACLGPDIGSKLSKALNIPAPSFKIQGLLQNYFLSFLLKKVETKKRPQPLSWLAKSHLSPLFSLSKSHIILLIDYLGLFDLAHDIRNIVDKKLLKRIYDILSDKEQKFIKAILHQKEKYPSQSLNLEFWDGDKEKLFRLLHHRGMLRMAVALSGSSDDFIWHFIHKLDSGRGTKLMKYIQKKGVDKVTEQRAAQVLFTINDVIPKQGSAS